MTRIQHPEYDVVIVGGGLVGASLAVALEPTGLSVAVIEPVEADSSEQPSFDERTIALTYGAREIYSGIGVWEQLVSRQAEPILDIHVSDRGHFGMTHLSHTDVGTEALGYVVPARVIGQVLHQRIQQCDTISLFCPATVEHLQQNRQTSEITVTGNDDSVTLTASLVVLADGGRSGLAGQVGIEYGKVDYQQSAILSIVDTDRDHHGRAFERFTGEGPLALLPHSDKRYALVWTTSPEKMEARMALPDDAFIAELQFEFGDRAGNFSNPTTRKCYPLAHGKVSNPVGQRLVTICNAAHTVHPVAGQGFNLGLRDVAVLAKLILHASQNQQDIGSASMLEHYAALRQRETWMVNSFTDGLIRLFCNRHKPVEMVRNLVLKGVELCPPAKRFLLKRTMGLAGKSPRAGAGLPHW